MSKSNACKTALLNLMFGNANFANLGDATGLRGSTVAGQLYFSLHNANPGKTGDQTTNEVVYGGYARVGVARPGGFTVSVDHVTPAATVAFPQCSSGSDTALFWGLGTASSGAGVLLYSGPLGSNLGSCVGDLTSDLITRPGHGLAANDRVVFFARPGDTIPAGLAEGTVYYVIATGLTTDAFKVSATQGGSAIDVTASGEAGAAKVTPLAIANLITPQLSTATTITED